jgi:hypothetical protein
MILVPKKENHIITVPTSRKVLRDYGVDIYRYYSISNKSALPIAHIEIPKCQNPDWQADSLAGELLIP